MAVVPKHGKGSQYDDKQDLSADQIHRFGQVANQAQKRKEQRNKFESILTAGRAAKKAAMKPIIKPKEDKPNGVRIAVWMLLIIAVCLWVMYMTR